MSRASLAISTAWNSQTHSDVRGMLREIKEVGFDAIEIGYNFTPQRLKELIALVRPMGIRVVSVHNFAPMPAEVRINRPPMDYYRLSSLDEKERRKAVDYTKRTIDTASLVSSQAVVIHAGTVELENDYVRVLLHLYNQGRFGSEEYLRAKERLLVARQAKGGAYLESVVRSLGEVLSYAFSSGIKVGLETRYYPNEIPNIEEAEYLLTLFQHKGLLYWHDIGHAEVSERLGISVHNDYLRRFADRMLGIHLHDLKGIDDHRAPFSGDLDFSKMEPYSGNSLIKVIEAHPPATSQQIKEAIRRLLQSAQWGANEGGGDG